MTAALEVVSSTPRPHFTSGKDPVPILQEAGWAPTPVWMGGKSRPNRHSIPDCLSRSQSLYRQSYPAHPQRLCSCLMDYFTPTTDSLRSVESSLSFNRCTRSMILEDDNGIIWEGTFRLSYQSLDVLMLNTLMAILQITFHV